MATPVRSNSRLSLAMERTDQWIFSQDIPTDVVVVVCEARFSLHLFMLVAKSNYFRKLILESKEPVLTKIDLSGIPGGPQIFEKAAKFCYGVNFEITVHNVAALRCAAEYLQMTDLYCDNNLAGRTEDFLAQVALSSLSGAIVVLKSCQDLLPLAEDVKIVQRCVDVVSLKKRGSNALTLASALITYTERNLRDLVRDQSGKCTKSSDSDDPGLYARERELLQSIVSHLPSEKAAFPINFLCCLLRTAIFVRASNSCKNELEKRISVMLEHVTVDDLLVMSFTYDGERLFDLDSVRKIISGFVEKEKSMGVFGGGDFKESYPVAMHKAHPNLDEIEREKVCSVMDPLKLTYEARLHASQNKRLPVQIVLHALYYDQLKLRSGADDQPAAAATRSQLQSDVSLVRENEALRSELVKMKLYVSDMQKNQGSSTKGASTTSGSRKHSFFSSMSKTLGKLNPFKHGSKDTFHIDDNIGVDVTKPRRRRFSIS
uniref:NPH3 domain-containing protein n=1 Tax=Salix viminalis TaxID=40686 RepID=A0A6N2LJ56_SALVM